MFKIGGPVFHFLLLKLRVTFDFALDFVNKSSRVAKIVRKKSLELNPWQKFYLNSKFILVLAEINLPIKKKVGK